MMKQVLVSVGIIAVVVGGFATFVGMQPTQFKIERSIAVAAPAENVFPLINDHHNSLLWSPWDKLDPEMKKHFEGPASGVGSIYSWEGNEKVGAGRITIMESLPNQKVSSKLENFKPMESTSTTELTLTPKGAGTEVRWALIGQKSYMDKFFCLFMNMDKVIGPDFEKGLAQLKTLAEAPAASSQVRTSSAAETH